MLFPYLMLVRPVNVVLVAVAVLVGASAAGRLSWESELLLASLAAALVAAAGYALNDARDVERDRQNKPRRPVAAGRVSPRGAAAVAAALALSGWALSWSVGAAEGLLVSAWVSPSSTAISTPKR